MVKTISATTLEITEWHYLAELNDGTWHDVGRETDPKHVESGLKNLINFIVNMKGWDSCYKPIIKENKSIPNFKITKVIRYIDK